MKKGRKRKILGMTKHPTAAGQAQFGDVDATGAQARMNERLARARMAEIERANRQGPETALLLGEGTAQNAATERLNERLRQALLNAGR